MRGKEVVSVATDGLLRGVTNAVLYWLFILGSSIGKSKTSYGAYQIFREADEALREVNYDTFKQALTNLRKKHLIVQKHKRTTVDIAVTAMGRKRLTELLPTYQKKRPWDGCLYLVSYDIAEVHRRRRDLLREYLRRIGCGPLQESLWITPYNPRDLVDNFIKEYGVKGTILVSRLGRDGAIGDEDIRSLVARVYRLSSLNDRYRNFLYEARKRRKTPFQLAVMYQSILFDDPQLPFTLLPKNWLGDRAHEVFQAIVSKSTSGRMHNCT